MLRSFGLSRWTWILATSLGGALGAFAMRLVALLLPHPYHAWWFWASLGIEALCVAFPQWLCLRDEVAGAWLWILVVPASWLTAVGFLHWFFTALPLFRLGVEPWGWILIASLQATAGASAWSALPIAVWFRDEPDTDPE